ncbi:aliphatic sulfonate ABC transporter substrate-binding protein [Peribacillus sp. SI8-4]|uniref:ABC transporter substrate-binding protein n=1 Tax=Peribacillus sp. SI8-4 TaxID=3048009 RepID=UPI00255454D7|nr:aliphatic sulfonate ABC transporter substrate-binding protein [Peribacillus sp. SI8-4]
MRKYRVHVTGLLLAVLISTTALAGCKSDAGKASGESEPVKVSIALNGKMGPLVIAKNKGLFDEEFSKLDAKISWSEFPSGPPLLESLASNRVDLSFLGDGALIAGIDKKLPFEVIAQTGQGGSSVRIITHTDGTIKQVKDLKGKTVGVASGTTGHVYLIKALKAYGLTTDDVKLINLQPDDAQSAFETKQLDAWATWNPYYLNNIEKGKAVALNVKGKILAPGAIIARTGFAKEHPEIVEAYLRVYKKAADWQIDHPDEASEIYAKATKMPAATVKKIITAEEPNIFFTEDAIKAQQESIDTLASVGYIKQSFDFQNEIHNEYIKEAFNN